MTAESDDVAQLKQEVERLQSLLLLANDAAFGLAGIFARAIVDAGLISRSELADSIERRAGLPDADDHNSLLPAFAKAIRMNFPGGRFDVITGGRPSEVDPE
jgi:hypothetical protein